MEQASVSKTPAWERYLSLAAEVPLKHYRETMEKLGPNPGWAKTQRAFLEMIDDYLAVELKKPVEANISAHEAGGQFRVAFPHQFVRGDQGVFDYMKATMLARKAYADENLYHGYVDCHEVHHEIENYIYFQDPLWYHKFPGMDVALASILDLAHHIGNWEPNVPAWYDWEKHEFVSNWLGTKGVRDYPPFDYQEGNHFRFVDVAQLAYLATKQPRYLKLVEDYCGHWCDHIEAHAAKGEPIPCSILPEAASIIEATKAGENVGKGSQYQIFYHLVADNTMYDIAGCLLDTYAVTGKERYLNCAEAMIDQFIDHSDGGRPGRGFKDGKWIGMPQSSGDSDKKKNSKSHFVTDCNFIARLALRHSLIAHSDKYKPVIMDWANAIDEENNDFDQMMPTVLVAAHYYDGDPKWLERAYLMALRVAAVSEDLDEFHQCNWTSSRQGTKFLMELLYTPMVGDVEFGTRGNLPVRLFAWETGSRMGLPKDLSARIWREQPGVYCLEAVNLGTEPAVWSGKTAYGGSFTAQRDGKEIEEFTVLPGETAQFRITLPQGCRTVYGEE
ncbi:MAG: hypothetical protein HFE44_13560 [Oscillospiraceae bacterium]|nr:hypothetical protein [Oscillospiraceae bacterium]